MGNPQDPARQKKGTGWLWPNRPGATHATWAGAREVRLAAEWGWSVEYLSGIKLTKANCLSPLITTVDTMLRRVARLWLKCVEHYAAAAALVAGLAENLGSEQASTPRPQEVRTW